MHDADIGRGSGRPYAVTLACTALALAAVLFFELRQGAGGAGRERGPGRTEHSEPSRPKPLAATSTASAESRAKPLLARPLFSPTRRPAEKAVQDASTPGPAAPLPRLAGVIVTPGGRWAIFAASGGKPATLREGDRLNGFVVQDIRPGHVSLRGMRDVRLVVPTRGQAAPVQMPVPVGLPGFPLQLPRSALGTPQPPSRPQPG